MSHGWEFTPTKGFNGNITFSEPTCVKISVEEKVPGFYASHSNHHRACLEVWQMRDASRLVGAEAAARGYELSELIWRRWGFSAGGEEEWKSGRSLSSHKVRESKDRQTMGPGVRSAGEPRTPAPISNYLCDLGDQPCALCFSFSSGRCCVGAHAHSPWRCKEIMYVKYLALGLAPSRCQDTFVFCW